MRGIYSKVSRAAVIIATGMRFQEIYPLQIESGWLREVAKRPSPNFNERPPGTVVDLLVVHAISLPPCEFGGRYIEDFFCNRLQPDVHPYFAEIQGLQVSAHCLIRRDGRVCQFVSFTQRAWHAGVSSFGGRSQCNDFSIGIELEGCDTQPFEFVQYQQLVKLTRLLQAEYPGITARNIVGHADIAPGRKTDPGPNFDWPYFFSLLKNSGD